MATIRCEYCGSSMSSDEQNCPQCGAPNPYYLPGVSAAPAGTGGRPRTIAELQAYCASKGMPLEKMRFFIGEDYREPRAFGIYRDGSDFVVYKNKADGSRAIRYRGPDEAHAVGELYDKLKAEHELRSNLRRTSASSGTTRGGGRRRGNFLRNIILPLVILFALSSVFTAISNRITHRNDGYYRVGEELFYHYGTAWFADSLYADDWYEVDAFPYEDYRDYYQGNEYDDSWGGSSFTDSQLWDELQDSGSDYGGDSYDYDSWDAGDTDWDSDW